MFLASLGHAVLGVDSSPVALEQARRLALERGVNVELHCADLATFELEETQFQTIVSIFCHLAPAIRRRVHGRVVRALRPGGIFVLEAFRPEQLTFGTGGPTELALLPTKEENPLRAARTRDPASGAGGAPPRRGKSARWALRSARAHRPQALCAPAEGTAQLAHTPNAKCDFGAFG
ncbi:MAG: class I SAM-dependent methyltransferase [Anaeromyxobacter sp.]